MRAVKSSEPFMNIRCEVITIADGLQCMLTEQFPSSLFSCYNQDSNKKQTKQKQEEHNSQVSFHLADMVLADYQYTSQGPVFNHLPRSHQEVTREPTYVCRLNSPTSRSSSWKGRNMRFNCVIISKTGFDSKFGF